MEFKGTNSQSNTNRVHQPQPQQPASRPTEGGKLNMVTRSDDGSKKFVVIGVIIAAVVVIGGLGWWAWGKFMSPNGINTGEYQAVFLTNGQVYFGKLSNVTDQYVDLTNIYYLQVQQDSTVQPADNKTTNQSPQVSLAKLGNELHGPEDHMSINRDQVLFWENLKDGGKVVQAIKGNQQK